MNNRSLRPRTGHFDRDVTSDPTKETVLEIKRLRKCVQQLKEASLKIIKAKVESAAERIHLGNVSCGVAEHSTGLRNKKKGKSSKWSEKTGRIGLQRKKQNKLNRRANENEEERRLRLQKQAQSTRERRAKETAEQGRLRREKQAQRLKEVRAKETEEERRVRQKKEAERVKERRAKNSISSQEHRLPARKDSRSMLNSEKVTEENEAQSLQASQSKSFECDLCEENLGTAKSLETHKSQIHAVSILLCCEHCGKQFKDLKQFQTHKRHHKNTGKKLAVQCEECGKTFAHGSSYRAHYLAAHTSERQFLCSVCGRAFTCKSSLHVHKINNCEKDKAKVATCPVCGKVLENYLLLSYHKANFHKYGNTEENVCHVCNKTVPNSFSLFNHNKYYHDVTKGEEQLSCKVCDKVCRNSVVLFDHWRTHREEKPFKCNLCSIMFQQRCSFYIHKKSAHKNDSREVKVIVDSQTLKKLKAEFKIIHGIKSVRERNSLDLEIVSEEILQSTSEYPEDSFTEKNDTVVRSVTDEASSPFENSTNHLVKAQLTEVMNPKDKSYIDFSRANVPDSTLISHPAMILDDIPDGETASKYLPVVELKETEEYNSLVYLKNSCIGDTSDESTDLFDYYASQEDSPLSLHNNFNTEDHKDIPTKFFVNDPYIPKLVVKLRKLEEYTCTDCSIIFHRYKCYRKHLNSNNHQSAARKRKRHPSLEIQYKFLETGNHNNNGEICFPCDLCDIEYFRYFIFAKPKQKRCKSSVTMRRLINSKQRKKTAKVKIFRQQYICETCGKVFASVNGLTNHNNTHTGQKPYKCDRCPKSYFSTITRKMHIEAEHERKRYICDICGISIKWSSYVKFHREGHQEKAFKCHHCPTSFASIGKRLKHMKRVHGKTKYSCQDCGKEFKERYMLKNHAKRHSDDPRQIKCQPKIYKHPCTLCSLKFHTQEAYDRHIGLHDSSRPYPCDQCSYYFNVSGHLRRHIESKHQKKTYTCDICSKVCTRSDELIKHHRKAHTERKGDILMHVMKKHLCRKCNIEFSDKKSLKEHRKLHIGDAKVNKCISCPLCSTNFRSQEAYDKHLGLHDSTRPFSCDLCSCFFNHNSNLVLHKKNVHQKLGINYKKKRYAKGSET